MLDLDLKYMFDWKCVLKWDKAWTLVESVNYDLN